MVVGVRGNCEPAISCSASRRRPTRQSRRGINTVPRPVRNLLQRGRFNSRRSFAPCWRPSASETMDADPFLTSYGITTLELSHARHQLAPAVLQARRRQVYTATYRARHRQKVAANRERKRHFAPDTDHVRQRKRLIEEMRGATSRRRAARRQCKHLESRLWRFWSCHVVYRALVGVQ